MKDTVKTISLRAAREALGTPKSFSGGLYVTKNGVPELFITTAADRAQELAQLQQECEHKALTKLVSIATQDIVFGKTYSLEETLTRLREARA
ncbi:hypothetical protein [Aeromonas rivipollensis]|uniref:hypothetical protein n=1 Tax=Aeromonas rivipollensis TaxID=948519 RepID=UPI00372D6A9C